MNEFTKPPKPFYKRTWFIVLAVIIGVGILFNMIGNEDTTSAEVAETVENAENARAAANSELIAEPEPEVKHVWTYETSKDEMTGKEIYFAATTSLNTLEFEFPYQGGTTFYLYVRNMKGQNDVLLTLTKGQFMGSIMSSEYCRIKFDDGTVANYTFNSPDDGSSDKIFFDNPGRLISNLKKAKKLMIEAPFFNEGRQVIYFDVEGLKWNR